MMNEKDNLDYIRVLLALNGNNDPELHKTLDEAEKKLNKKSIVHKIVHGKQKILNLLGV